MGPMPRTIIHVQLIPSLLGFAVFADGDPGLGFFVLDRILLWDLLVLILVWVSLPLPELLGLIGEVSMFPLQFLNDITFTLTLEFLVLRLEVVHVSPTYQELVQSSLLFEGLVSFRELIQSYVCKGPPEGIVIHLIHDLPDLWILVVDASRLG